MCTMFMCEKEVIHILVCTYVHVCMWRPKIAAACLVQLLATLFFEAGFLTEPGDYHFS